MGKINWGITQEEYDKLSVGDIVTVLVNNYEDGVELVTSVVTASKNDGAPWSIEGARYNIVPYLGGRRFAILKHEPKPPEWREAKVIKGTTDYFVRNDDGGFVNCEGNTYEVACFRDPTIIVDKDGNVRA